MCLGDQSSYMVSLLEICLLSCSVGKWASLSPRHPRGPFFLEKLKPASPPAQGSSHFLASKKHCPSHPHNIPTEFEWEAMRNNKECIWKSPGREEWRRSLSCTYEEFMGILAAGTSFSQNFCKRSVCNWKVRTPSSMRAEGACRCTHTAVWSGHCDNIFCGLSIPLYWVPQNWHPVQYGVFLP